MSVKRDLAIEHLLLRLRPLNRALRAAVERQGEAAKRLIRPDVTHLCVTEDQVLTLLEDVDAMVERRPPVEKLAPQKQPEIPQPEEAVPPESIIKKHGSFFHWAPWGVVKPPPPPPPQPEIQREEEANELTGDVPAAELPALTAEEEHLEQEVRRRAGSAGIILPLDRLQESLKLTPIEEDAVVLCTASELDRSYERIFAYILDDLYRRLPCVELICLALGESMESRVPLQHALGRFGRLRRYGILQPVGESPNELRQELRLGTGLFEYLTGGSEEIASKFGDLAEVTLPEQVDLPSQVDSEQVKRLAAALREGNVKVIGIWGPQNSGQEEVAQAIAVMAGKHLRRLPLPDPQFPASGQEGAIRESVQMAETLGAILWVPTGQLGEAGRELTADALDDALGAANVATLLTGKTPWRPLRLLETRSYAEIELVAPGYLARKEMWGRVLPYLSEGAIGSLALRFRLSPAEARVVAGMAATEARLSGEDAAAPGLHRIEHACGAVLRRGGHRFATSTQPARGPKDLVLPEDLHRQVVEVAKFFRAWPRVAEEWGFGSLETGIGGGIKALFTGDSGTGKTLAAEVIAHELQMPLLKVDLAQIVSKWVGETEKHLEAAFREAEDSNAVLFFDEADALFGKRGEVRHGVDRYANLEVSYLLQRIEDHYGLVILASNLKDNIDAAFTRRFQIVINFPRPGVPERRRMWELAFPNEAPLDKGIDLDVLAGLDMTGAAIVGAARTAALLASDQGSETITRSHIIQGVARQYRREARILMPGELGPYADDLKEAR
jgi:hypothetical protein